MSPAAGFHLHYPTDGGVVEHDGPRESCDDPSLGPFIEGGAAPAGPAVPDQFTVYDRETRNAIGDHNSLAVVYEGAAGPAVHMKQSGNGCVTCSRKWSQHTDAEKLA